MSKIKVQNMAEVRELNDDNGDEHASERVWSALSLAIYTIDKMRPYLILAGNHNCICTPDYHCLTCDARRILNEID